MLSKPGEVVVRVLAVVGLTAASVLAGQGARAGDGHGVREDTGYGVRAGVARDAEDGTRAGVAREAEHDVRAGAGRAARGDGGERILFRFKDSRITESSGLAVSPTGKDVYYTHNDSSAGPVFFAVGPDGRTRATFTLRGAASRDWEGMAASVDPRTGRGVLWFADIGDNLEGAWPDISVYKVAEPTALSDAVVSAVRYRFRYEDGGHNAEGIMVHPLTGRLYIVTKQFAGAVYQAPKRLRTDRVNVLRKVGSAPIMATDAAYAPDGSSFVIRTYFSATVYRAPGEQIARVTMPELRQAESITYTRDGRYLLTGSEGSRSPVYRVPLPREVLGEAAPEPTYARRQAASTPTSGTPGDPAPTPVAAVETGGDADTGVPISAVLLWLAIAAGATGVITLIARRTR
ncbi:WD40 repeat domain-containing protein [Streptosporangium oxazolinicum]|uniref:WD40 repeat domain-containing protein n=1 Tax=Streptosporangium oxazolinicum TaxID=909287 RepID=A0ABP8BE11_9ACTN